MSCPNRPHPCMAASFLAALLVLASSASPLRAQSAAGVPMEPRGGAPAPGTKPSVADMDEQVAYQRAFEAVIWAQPAVGIFGIRRGTLEGLGMKDNDVLAMSRPLTTRHEFLTANNTTPYIAANADLRTGPVVVEIPPAIKKGAMYGQIVDAWQMSVADVGPSGEDKGRGGKYLLLPPGYKHAPSAGYIVVHSRTYRIALALRSIKLPGMTDADANAYAKTLKIYPLADAAHPKPTRFVDGYDKRISTLPYYDWRYFKDLHDIISVEPVFARDKVMMGMLASIGILPDKPFELSPKMKDILNRAAADAYFYMQDRFQKVQMKNLYWPERHWSYFFLPDADRGFSFETATALLYDNRADMYHPGTYYPRKIGDRPATVYLCGMADGAGNPLEAGKTYRLHVPKGFPVKQFWALTIYDYATWAFIYNRLDRVGLSSYDKSKLKMNADGSTDLYFGPTAPAGFESNWIPTQDKRPFPVMRCYAPEEAFWNKSWKLPDPELVR